MRYQQRFDAIPNLVRATQGAMAQEREVFEAIAETRTRDSGARTPDEQARAATGVAPSGAGRKGRDEGERVALLVW